MKSLKVIAAMVSLVVMLAGLACSGDDDGSDDAGATQPDVTEPAGDVGEEPSGEVTEPGEEVTLPDEEVTAEDTDPPEVVLNLEAWTAMQGSMELDLEWTDNSAVTMIEVVLDNEVVGEVKLKGNVLDTTVFEPGYHKLALRAYDEAGNTTLTEGVPIMAAGPGEFLEFTDGWKTPTLPGWAGFEINVPPGATSIYDEKAHVQMPSGIKSVKAYMRWTSDVSWDMGLDIGTGNCPDSGKKLAMADEEAPEWLLKVEYEKDGEDVPTGKWFAHIRFKDGGNHGGEDQQFDLLFLALP